MNFFRRLFGSSDDERPPQVPAVASQGQRKRPPLEPPISSICPYCGFQFEKPPLRKAKCKACGNYIYVRARPSDWKRVLLTEAEAEKLEQEWQELAKKEEELNEANWEQEIEEELYEIPVVGESFYQDALDKLAGPKTEEGAQLRVLAELHPEPENPYDKKAVAVYVGGLKVGHLTREHANNFGKMMTAMHKRGQGLKDIKAEIRGGWLRRDNEGSYGVVLYPSEQIWDKLEL